MLKITLLNKETGEEKVHYENIGITAFSSILIALHEKKSHFPIKSDGVNIVEFLPHEKWSKMHITADIVKG